MPRIMMLVATLLLTACASDSAPPTIVVLQVQAAADLNPSTDGQATPVRVRLYELKGGAAFDRADYFSLVDSADATLAADLLAQDELLVRPGQRLSVERQFDERSRWLGLVVAYRELDRAVWRQLVSIPVGETSELDVVLGARAVSATPAN